MALRGATPEPSGPSHRAEPVEEPVPAFSLELDYGRRRADVGRRRADVGRRRMESGRRRADVSRPGYRTPLIAAGLVAVAALMTVAVAQAVAPSGGQSGESDSQQAQPRAATPAAPPSPPAVPANSGEGRRVVFDLSDERIWMLADDDTLLRTYDVSDRTQNELPPGTYQVLMREPAASAVHGTGTLDYFVRFGTGSTAPIGFHAVPDGASSITGSVAQPRADAEAMWSFAEVGTPVVVTQ